jgi:uncharacterized protein
MNLSIRASRAAQIACAFAILSGVTSSTADAAVWDCSRAMSPTETTICSQAELKRRDDQLTTVFLRLMHVAPARTVELRASQLRWLTKRDQCGEDQACIGQRYEERVTELRKQLHGLLAYKPDDLDRAALEDLKQTVDAIRQSDTEFPLEKALDQFRLRDGITSFEGGDKADADTDAASLPHQRPDGVTEDEWQALKVSGPFSDGAAIEVDYTLVRVEGEPHRALFVTTLDNGSGVYSYSTVWLRRGDRFVSVLSARTRQRAANEDDDIAEASLLSFQGKGANQTSQWVRLRGRVYAAYINSEFGEDDVYLVRPLTFLDRAPQLTVRYRYHLMVPRGQKRDSPDRVELLDALLYAALNAAVKPTTGPFSSDTPVVQGRRDDRKPLCPIPARVTGDDRENYFNYGPSDGSVEIIDDTSVSVNGTCYLARLIDNFGSYLPDQGLMAQISIRVPQGAETERDFAVRGKRIAIRTETSTGKIPGDHWD